jgi:hypothetical protein
VPPTLVLDQQGEDAATYAAGCVYRPALPVVSMSAVATPDLVGPID